MFRDDCVILVQLLGLVGLGSAGGFERLHFLLERAFDGPHLTNSFLIVSCSPLRLSLPCVSPMPPAIPFCCHAAFMKMYLLCTSMSSPKYCEWFLSGKSEMSATSPEICRYFPAILRDDDIEGFKNCHNHPDLQPSIHVFHFHLILSRHCRHKMTWLE
jgi:hypothetical protein